MVTAPLVVVQEPQQPAGVSAGSASPQSTTGALHPLQLGALFLGVLQQSRTSTRPDLHLGLGRGLWWSCEFVTELLGFCGETLSPFRASVTSLIKGKLVLIDFHYVLQRSSSKRC